jgi:hypothetical protein
MELFTDKLEQQKVGERVYSLFCVRGSSARGFILCVEEDGEGAMELFDGSEEQARELFDTLVSQKLCACHLFDIVYDNRRALQLEMF